MFFDLYDGLINLDHVLRVDISGSSREKNYRIFHFIGTDGSTIARREFSDRYAFDLEKLTAPIVPAAPDQRAYRFYVFNDPGERPTEKDIDCRLVRILAWRITEYPEAIMCEKLGDNEELVIVEADGSLVSQENTSFEDLDRCRAYMLDQAQRDWDRAHQEKKSD